MGAELISRWLWGREDGVTESSPDSRDIAARDRDDDVPEGGDDVQRRPTGARSVPNCELTLGHQCPVVHPSSHALFLRPSSLSHTVCPAGCPPLPLCPAFPAHTVSVDYCVRG